MVKDLRYIEINNVNPLYHIVNKINGYIEESEKQITKKQRKKQIFDDRFY